MKFIIKIIQTIILFHSSPVTIRVKRTIALIGDLKLACLKIKKIKTNQN